MVELGSILEGSITVSWTVSESVDGFEVEVDEAGLGFLPLEIGQLGATELSVEITGLLEGVSYVFRVRALRDGLASLWAETEAVEILLPEEPALLEATHFWTFDLYESDLAVDEGTAPLNLDVSQAVRDAGIGTSNSGLYFTGGHSGIQVPDCSTLNHAPQGEITVSLWVRLDDAGNTTTSVLYEQGGFWRGLNLLVVDGKLEANGWNRPATESNWAGTTLSGGALPINVWTHVALVLKAGESIEEEGLKLYVDGNLVASGPASQLWKQNDNNGFGQVQQSTLYRGRQVRALDPFQGSLDDASIWNAALTGDELVDLIALSNE